MVLAFSVVSPSNSKVLTVVSCLRESHPFCGNSLLQVRTVSIEMNQQFYIRNMDFKEYEQFTATIIKDFKQFKNAAISTNCRVKGIRQPGEYEIDILVRIRLQELLDFTIIVECKQWNKKVDRPVVQKLIQTKDAISAQKAVIVSPIGFTQEAIEVAKANGVALWILTEENIVSSSFASGSSSDTAVISYSQLVNEINDMFYDNLSHNLFGQTYLGDYIESYGPEFSPDYPKAGAQKLRNTILLFVISNEEFLYTNYEFLKKLISKATGKRVNNNKDIYNLLVTVANSDYDQFCIFYKQLPVDN